jgi:hypothetical protein
LVLTLYWGDNTRCGCPGGSDGVIFAEEVEDDSVVSVVLPVLMVAASAEPDWVC